MNRTVLALAVLGAFAGAAAAQSSVTLYGRVEANVTNSKPGSNVNGGDSVWRLDNGGDNSGLGGSRFGFRGVEDLGSGLRAYFVLESGFRADTGAFGNATRIFDRSAYVALGSSSLGDVRFGRQETLTRVFNSTIADATALGEIKIDEAVAVGGGILPAARPLFQTFGQRVDNAITYSTPNFGGFQLTGLVALGEGPTAARQQGVSAVYRAGPVAVGLTFEMYDGFGDTYNKVLSVGGNYNFGFASLFAAYQRTKDFGSQTAAPTGDVGSIDKYNAYNVGVLVPFGNLSVRAQYTRADYDLFGASDVDTSKYGLSARYAVSKRTTLYSAISQRSGDDKSSFTTKREITVLGVAHTF